jgi:hypothetical protein
MTSKLAKEKKDPPTTSVIEFSSLKCKFANLYDTWGSDPDLEKNGVTLDYALENGKRVEFLIKRAGPRNAHWKKVYNEHMRDSNNELKVLNEAESTEVLSTVYSETVIIGWKGVEDKDGKEIPFNKKDCKELLKFLPELLQMILNDSHDRANFREQETEHARKN